MKLTGTMSTDFFNTPANFVIDSDLIDKAGLEITARRRTFGPEANLVDRFLENFQISIPNDCRISTFVEPRIGTCFPDIVVVVWHPASTRNWYQSRTALTLSDLKLIHLLYSIGPAEIPQIEKYYKKNLFESLTRLLKCNIVSKDEGKWILKPLDEIFAIRKILAFEAKMKPNGDVIQQAVTNLWFANSSYVLLPNTSPSEGIKTKFLNNEVQLWIEGNKENFCELAIRSVGKPVSYISWQLNEWVWKLSKAQVF